MQNKKIILSLLFLIGTQQICAGWLDWIAPAWQPSKTTLCAGAMLTGLAGIAWSQNKELTQANKQAADIKKLNGAWQETIIKPSSNDITVINELKSHNDDAVSGNTILRYYYKKVRTDDKVDFPVISLKEAILELGNEPDTLRSNGGSHEFYNIVHPLTKEQKNAAVWQNVKTAIEKIDDEIDGERNYKISKDKVITPIQMQYARHQEAIRSILNTESETIFDALHKASINLFQNDETGKILFDELSKENKYYIDGLPAPVNEGEVITF